MTDIIEKKRQAYRSLLKTTEEMSKAWQSGDIEALNKAAATREEVISTIIGTDEEAMSKTMSGTLGASPAVVEEILGLIVKISDLNESLQTNISEKIKTVGKELSDLNRGAEVVARYAKIGAL